LPPTLQRGGCLLKSGPNWPRLHCSQRRGNCDGSNGCADRFLVLRPSGCWRRQTWICHDCRANECSFSCATEATGEVSASTATDQSSSKYQGGRDPYQNGNQNRRKLQERSRRILVVGWLVVGWHHLRFANVLLCTAVNRAALARQECGLLACHILGLRFASGQGNHYEHDRDRPFPEWGHRAGFDHTSTPPSLGAPGTYAFQAVVLLSRGDVLAGLKAAVLGGFVVGAMALGLAVARLITDRTWRES
jgi:hypothetical protein